MNDRAPGYYRLRVQLDPQPEGGWTITSPDVPGLVTEANTIEEIEANVRDAFAALAESYDSSELPPTIRCAPNFSFTIETFVATGLRYRDVAPS